FLLHALTVFNFFSVVLFVLLFLRLPTSPLFPYTTLFRSVESSSSLFAVRAGVLWLRLPSRDLTPESLRGSESPRILPSVLPVTRSEEHTSELQSRFDLVCRLLLEKKKTTNKLPLLL